jgi:hypothetical protein
MVEKFNERANALATEYWRLKEMTAEKTGEKRLEEIEKLLETGIGGKLQENLEAEAKRLRQEAESKSNALMRLEEVKKEILELTAELAPNLDLFDESLFPYDSDHEPIYEEYFTALTNIFFGTPAPSIQFKVATFSTEGIKVVSSGENSPFKVLGYALMIIQETAKKMLGMENKIDKSCLRLKQNEYALIALQILHKEGRELEIKEIKEIAHREDKEYKELVSDVYDKELVNSVAYLLSNDWEYGLVKETNGKYEMMDFGEWVWNLCNVEASKGEGRRGEKGAPKSSLDLHRLLKFIKKEGT